MDQLSFKLLDFFVTINISGNKVYLFIFIVKLQFVDIFDPYLVVSNETSWRSLSGVRANIRILQLVPSLKVWPLFYFIRKIHCVSAFFCPFWNIYFCLVYVIDISMSGINLSLYYAMVCLLKGWKWQPNLLLDSEHLIILFDLLMDYVECVYLCKV